MTLKTWNEPLDASGVYSALKKRARIKAAIGALELDIEEIELEVKAESPRDKTARDSKTLPLRRKRQELLAELYDVDGEIGYADYHAEMFKTMTYRMSKQIS